MKSDIKALRVDDAIKVVKVKITPEEAEEMLRKNKHNRPIVNSAFERMARDMREGNWRLTGDTIKFDPMGNLIDGQHRLWACIEAGVAFETFVAYGVSPDAFDVIDTGMKRSSAAMMHLKGERDTALLAGATNLYWKYEKKYLQKAAPVSPTNRETMRCLEQNPGLRDAVSEAKRVKHLVSAAVAGFVFYVTAQKSPDEAVAFFDKLSAGEGLLGGDPVLALRERLIRNKTSIAKLRQRDLVILMLKAWNAFRERRKVRTLPIIKKERGQAAESFPQIA